MTVQSDTPAPLTAADVVPGQVFMMSSFAQTISGPKFSHHSPILIAPFKPKSPTMVYYWVLTPSGDVRDSSRLLEQVLARIHRRTNADEELITKLVARAQKEINRSQMMVSALTP